MRTFSLIGRGKASIGLAQIRLPLEVQAAFVVTGPTAGNAARAPGQDAG